MCSNSFNIDFKLHHYMVCNILFILTEACEAGYKRVGTSTCVKCPIGEYQPLKWQTSCLSCGGARYRTDQDASTSKDECKCE